MGASGRRCLALAVRRLTDRAMDLDVVAAAHFVVVVVVIVVVAVVAVVAQVNRHANEGDSVRFLPRFGVPLAT